MNAEILCIGTELLLGDIVNTNAAYLARGLAGLGIHVYYQSVVGDNPQRLAEAFRLALSRADIVITTGGLGPTYDDLSKETAAACFGRRMVMDPHSQQRLHAYFQKLGREMTPNNEKQALMPEGATVFDNHNGTAPGLAIEQEGKHIILLPGPPREVYPMFEESVAPYLSRYTDHLLLSHTIHIFGLGESSVEHQIHDWMAQSQNPTIAPYAKEGEVQLRVTAAAKDKAAAEALMAPALQRLQREFGPYIYGVDVGDLQTALVQRLQANGQTIAVAESCTGGLVAKRLTEVPGASGVFGFGFCTYANLAKERLLGVRPETLERYGAVSAETAAEMAAGCRAASGADIAVAVTGIAGPDGGTAEKPVGLVYVAVESEGFSQVQQLRLGRGFTREREHIRYLASSHALALALRAAGGLAGPLEDEKTPPPCHGCQ